MKKCSEETELFPFFIVNQKDTSCREEKTHPHGLVNCPLGFASNFGLPDILILRFTGKAELYVWLMVFNVLP